MADRKASADYLAEKNYDYAMARARAARHQAYNQTIANKKYGKPKKKWYEQYYNDLKEFYF